MSTEGKYQLRDTMKKHLAKIGGVFKNIHNMNSGMVKIICIIIITVVVLWAAIYASTTYAYGGDSGTGCSRMKAWYASNAMPPLSSFNVEDGNYQFLLRDYYIKTAYNCCAIGDFDNNYVNNCALIYVLRQGVRCLDFEIYSVDNKPVIAASNVNNIHIKETFNGVPFSTAMRTIRNYAFDSKHVPNSEDPLILQFRIKSKNKVIYDDMAKTLGKELDRYVLGKAYSNEFQGNNLGSLPLKSLSGYAKENSGRPRVIVIADKSDNDMFEQTDLDEYVNIASGSIFMRLLPVSKVSYSNDQDELKKFNQKSLTMVIPDPIPSTGSISNMYCCVPGSQNIPYFKNNLLGCQMSAMCYQNNDDYLKQYEKSFADVGHAFVPKPACLRFKPATIPDPIPQKPENSFATRSVSGSFYSFNI